MNYAWPHSINFPGAQRIIAREEVDKLFVLPCYGVRSYSVYKRWHLLSLKMEKLLHPPISRVRETLSRPQWSIRNGSYGFESWRKWVLDNRLLTVARFLSCSPSSALLIRQCGNSFAVFGYVSCLPSLRWIQGINLMLPRLRQPIRGIARECSSATYQAGQVKMRCYILNTSE